MHVYNAPKTLSIGSGCNGYLLLILQKETLLMRPNRRDFFRVVGTGAAGLSISSMILSSACKSPLENRNQEDGQVLFIGDDIAVTGTA
jgi:hypothetical protein